MTAKARKNTLPFKVGDKVISVYSGQIFTVRWTSKNALNRGDQLIATEYNGYCNTTSDAVCYDLAQ